MDFVSGRNLGAWDTKSDITDPPCCDIPNRVMKTNNWKVN